MKNFIYIFTFVLASSAIAQNSTTIAFEKQKLNQAKAYNDDTVITATIYNIIALEGPSSTYKDTLAYRYFSSRKFVSCFLVTNDLLKSKPDNLDLLEMNAASLESMGALDKAHEVYVNLLSKKNDNYHGYKLAGIEFRMNKNEEAYATIKKAATLKEVGEIQITFQVNQNFNQNIDLKAAISYLEGLIAESLNKQAEAKIAYEKAIVLSPEFMLAKSKLELLNAKLAEEKTN